jgi:hypothetical protein
LVEHGGEQYSERELALILKRAAELQGSEEPSRMRYSLVEIQEIAQGAGIDAESVALAASELRRASRSSPWLLGGPTRFRAERTTDVPVRHAAFAEIVDTIRVETGLQGEAKQVFDTLEWKGQDIGGHVFVTLAPRGDQTRVTVTAARTDEAILAGMWGVGAAIVTSGALAAVLALAHLPAPVVAVLAAAGGVTGMIGATRLIWRSKMTKWTRRAGEIADAVAGRLSP